MQVEIRSWLREQHLLPGSYLRNHSSKSLPKVAAAHKCMRYIGQNSSKCETGGLTLGLGERLHVRAGACSPRALAGVLRGKVLKMLAELVKLAGIHSTKPTRRGEARLKCCIPPHLGC